MNIIIDLIIIFSLINSSFQQDQIAEDPPIVTIPNGQLLGISNKTTGQNTTYYAFKGIPYAEPPIGDLRFKSPQKVSSWNGTLNATIGGSMCTQISGINVIGTEDCLFLNVYTPDINGSLPVMVWIHGGAFTSGSGDYSDYQPDFLLDEGVVMVTLNYRLGVFGWLSTEDLNCPGNWGLKDQTLALEWVRDNIQYFGGNPDNVTIFGESAGAASVSYLMQSNKTAGLFKRAIMQSGTSLNLWTLNTTPRRNAFRVGLGVGIITTDSETLVTRLRTVRASRLMNVANLVSLQALVDNSLAGLPFAPVIEPDHEDAAFSGNSHDLLESGNFHQVPSIIGYNTNEAAALNDYLALLTGALITYDIDVIDLAPYDLTRDFSDRLVAALNIRAHYFGILPIWTQQSDVIKFANEDQFFRPIREAVNQMSKYSDVYFYVFSYAGRAANNDRNYDGVAHAEDVNYVLRSELNYDQSDTLMRSIFAKLWTNFAKTGNPTPLEDEPLLNGVLWTPAKNTTQINNDDVNYLNLNVTLSMSQNPNEDEWEYYKTIYERYGNSSHSTY